MKPTRKALFLDRDGVINEDPGYVHTPEAMRFIDGIFDLCRAAVAQGYLLVVVTNQAGIGRGYYTEAQFHALSAWMKEVFARNGAALAEIYFCPSHPEFGIGEYKCDSPDRKPNPGMLLKAQARFGIDLAASMMIGDKPSDTEAAARAGVGRRLRYDPQPGAAVDPHASMTIRDLREAIPLLSPDPIRVTP